MLPFPGTNTQVAFGALDAPPPDWRSKVEELDAEEDKFPEGEELQSLIDRLGFNPRDYHDDEDSSTDDNAD